MVNSSTFTMPEADERAGEPEWEEAGFDNL
jgi:hypothetical protein